jgi:hypothetical protein
MLGGPDWAELQARGRPPIVRPRKGRDNRVSMTAETLPPGRRGPRSPSTHPAFIFMLGDTWQRQGVAHPPVPAGMRYSSPGQQVVPVIGTYAMQLLVRGVA